MPSLFSTWRPKLQIRLKRLPRSDGPSTDEEEADEEQDERVTKRRLALENNDFIVDSAPSSARLRRHENGSNKRRAVRFFEEQPPLVSPLLAPSVLPPFPAPLAHHFPSPRHSSSPSRAFGSSLYNENGQIGANGSTEMAMPMNGAGGVENVQPPRPARSGASGGTQQRPSTFTGSRATLLLQQLREPRDDTGIETTSANVDTTIGLPNFVFLEFQGETKRSVLPTNVRSVEQIKSLFLRSFPSLNPAQLRSPGVKVYIQNAHSSHRLFYELEDIREVGNHSVLKLFEQSPNVSSPRSTAVLPSRLPRPMPVEEYFSEPDMVDWTVSISRAVEHTPQRPASVLPQLVEQKHPMTNGPAAIGWREQTSDSWQSSSAYSSDSSASGPYARSGTTTPVHTREDQHTQRKVDSLERQLASLSELVRSALLPTRELSGTHWQELSQFHTDIVGFSGIPSASAVGIGTMSESVSSTTSNATLPLEKCTTAQPKRKVNMPELAAIRADLEAMRSETIRNALRGRALLEQTLDRMRMVRGWPRTEQDELERRKDCCAIRLERLQKALREFEQALENTRASVLNSTRRLHLIEVDELTSKLGEIGREAVELKVEMPTLHSDIEETMKRLMERLEGEERFLREKVPLADGCLRRCKTLANVMVTMKKLAMVQDERGGEGRAVRRSIPSKHVVTQHKSGGSSRASTVPTEADAGGSNQHNHPLDAILDELNDNKL